MSLRQGKKSALKSSLRTPDSVDFSRPTTRKTARFNFNPVNKSGVKSILKIVK